MQHLGTGRCSKSVDTEDSNKDIKPDGAPGFKCSPAKEVFPTLHYCHAGVHILTHLFCLSEMFCSTDIIKGTYISHISYYITHSNSRCFEVGPSSVLLLVFP